MNEMISVKSVYKWRGGSFNTTYTKGSKEEAEARRLKGKGDYNVARRN